jgi:hypothetical protein
MFDVEKLRGCAANIEVIVSLYEYRKNTDSFPTYVAYGFCEIDPWRIGSGNRLLYCDRGQNMN